MTDIELTCSHHDMTDRLLCSHHDMTDGLLLWS